MPNRIQFQTSVIAAAVMLASPAAWSASPLPAGGVLQVEGAAGGELTPWAVIGAYGTRDQIGGNAFYARVEADDYALDGYGVLVGLYDRVELSIARQSFNAENVGALLGLGQDFKFKSAALKAPNTFTTTLI